jgi:DNA polymerase-3 subunit beta
MQFSIQKQIFESVLTNIQPFLEKKDQTQITSHIKFTLLDNNLKLEATDNEIGLSIQNVGCEQSDNFIFTANGKKILDIVRILKNGVVNVTLSNDNIVISQESSRFKLPTYDYNAFAQFPSQEDKSKITLDSSKLIESFKKIIPTIDTNNPKYELNGALIDIKSDKTNIVGTDTRRLGVKTIEGSNENELSIIIPKKAIIEIQKLFLDQIEIFYDETNLIIKSNNYYFFTRLINGKYPDYERIIPKSCKHMLKLNKKEMIESIKMIETVSNDIKISIFENEILFESLAEDNLEAKTSMNIQNGIENGFTMAISSRYLLDFLNQTSGEEFEFNLNEPNLPFLLKENDFITVVMPIVL